MAIIKFNQSNALPEIVSDFFDTDGFINDRFFTPSWGTRELTKSIPSANVKETTKGYDIELAVPGLDKGDFKIGIENDVLSISAEKQNEKKEENEKYTRKEFHYDAFNRSFRLPDTINADKIDAKYENGLLKISIPKKDQNPVPSKKEIKLK